MSSSVISNATSGLLASQNRLYAAASNIANAADTPKFSALVIDQHTAQDGGVVSQISQSDSDVSIDDQLVQAQQAVNDFKANATVLATQKKLQGSLLDILA